MLNKTSEAYLKAIQDIEKNNYFKDELAYYKRAIDFQRDYNVDDESIVSWINYIFETGGIKQQRPRQYVLMSEY